MQMYENVMCVCENTLTSCLILTLYAKICACIKEYDIFCTLPHPATLIEKKKQKPPQQNPGTCCHLILIDPLALGQVRQCPTQRGFAAALQATDQDGRQRQKLCGRSWHCSGATHQGDLLLNGPPLWIKKHLASTNVWNRKNLNIMSNSLKVATWT